MRTREAFFPPLLDDDLDLHAICAHHCAELVALHSRKLIQELVLEHVLPFCCEITQATVPTRQALRHPTLYLLAATAAPPTR